MVTKQKIFNRRFKNWVYHTVYTDDTRTKTKRVLDWAGRRYDVKLDSERNAYFIKGTTKYIIQVN